MKQLIKIVVLIVFLSVGNISYSQNNGDTVKTQETEKIARKKKMSSWKNGVKDLKTLQNEKLKQLFDKRNKKRIQYS